MAPKGGNAKKEGGRAKKAENEANKKAAAAAEKEAQEAAKWSDGGKANKNADKEEKRKAELARKAENARLLAEEESAAPAKAKPAPKAGAKKAAPKPKPAGPGAIAAGGGLGAASAEEAPGKAGAPKEEPESYTATGLDNALDLLEVVTAKMDKASVGSQAAGLERHPERRFKAAFEAYKEREMPILRKEHPGLRQQQMHDILYKNFQKSPENPFNQVNVSYDASKDERVKALEAKKAQVEHRLRDRS
ncbi:DUF1014-domain-containing protein [Schizophyllum fasciatum]